jgi:hypothetical protein
MAISAAAKKHAGRFRLTAVMIENMAPSLLDV